MSLDNLLKKMLVGGIVSSSLLLNGCALLTPQFKPYSISEIRDASQTDSAEKNGTDQSLFDVDFGRFSWQDAIKYVSTPREAQYYCNWLCATKKFTNVNSYIPSFKEVHEGNQMDCVRGAIAAAALLSDNGYAPLALTVCDNSTFSCEGHIVFIYKQNGKFGSVGINKHDFHEPKFDTVRDLAQDIVDHFPDNWNYYGVLNFADNHTDFISGSSEPNKSCGSQHLKIR